MDLRERTVELLPKQAIRLFSGPYVAGDSLEAALRKANELANLGVASTLDVLGEDAASTADIDHYISVYGLMIRAVADDPRLSKLPERLRPSVSLKPSSFIVAPKDQSGKILNPAAGDWDGCESAIRRIVGLAADNAIRSTVDMEDHQWTDFTLALYGRLFAECGRSVGTVLQSRLFRTGKDVENLPQGCRIRLCIGIYDEPPEIARTKLSDVKDRMIPLARRLFEKDVFVELATHDLGLIERLMTAVVIPNGITSDRFETQTLLGVPRQRLIHDLTTGSYFAGLNGGPSVTSLRQGVVHRMYVPFAEHWDQAIAYCRRRLRHSPNLFWTGLVNAPRVLYYSIFGR